MKFADTLLLTGAGYSANFGGFLGREMWSWIFNNSKLNNAGSLKRSLRNKFDFEAIYSEVFDERSNLPSHETEIFKEVVNEAYLAMDAVIQTGWDNLPIHHADATKFLGQFIESDGGTCFTLNQDLAMEKRFGWNTFGPLSIRYKGNWGSLDLNDLDSTDKVLPTADEIDKYKTEAENSSRRYIKLHGSLNWISQDGSDSKVIGINKMTTITKIPLLKWYFDLFKEAISTGDKRLVIIGYGFRDDHINSLLAEACEKNNLKLYIISPTDPVSFQEDLLYRGQGALRSEDPLRSKIWNGVYGYFPYKFSELFPSPQITSNPKLAEIHQALFSSFALN
ncbi:MAG: SIR2 family protein [Candidatus Curtissbacteria bacterium]|nr:SIR2 family protein [Candidatus Curtissbacteria bacterium]